MRRRLLSFLTSDSGAITVDWVVLTAAIIALAGTSATLIGDGVATASTHIETGLAAQPTGQRN